MTQSTLSEAVLSDLRLEDGDGDYIATVGITMTLMYAQRMEVLAPVFKQMVENFSDYIAPLKFDSTKPSDEWRDYSPRQLNRMLNRFMAYAEYGAELVLAKLDEDSPFQYFGEFGLRLKGRSENHTSFRHTDVCAAYFELPLHEVTRAGREKLLALVRQMADLAPFSHGMCGYTWPAQL